MSVDSRARSQVRSAAKEDEVVDKAQAYETLCKEIIKRAEFLLQVRSLSFHSLL